ncbi:MAG TPA: aminotransferase class IV [Blastocatellia bacterium]|nr:aminotransferase class IV [Blastocatellia bacterium]
MDPLIYHNGRIIEASAASIRPTSAGLLYGWGVFTTLRIDSKRVFAFERYWQRLERHALVAGISLPLQGYEAAAAVDQLIDSNGVCDGRARITVAKSTAGTWSLPSNLDSDFLIFTSSEQVRPSEDVAITISPYRTLSHGPLAGVKRVAMLENLLALEEARSRGFNEAVMFNERGEIVTATAANLFWSVSNQLFTPSLATGCVPGITRSYVLDIARKLSLTVEEGSFPVQRLLDANEVFLTSTVRGVVQAASFDVKEYPASTAWMGRVIAREFQKLI